MLNGFKFLEGLQKWKGGGFRLEAIKEVLNALGNPQDQVKMIHIGGTNGKGSASAFVANILAKEGFKVGLTISPHLMKLNERIIVDGLSIGDELLNDILLELQLALIQQNQELSYHEALTAAAFICFAKAKVDWAVVEVGLGGRLDASNVITRPEVSAIVSIGHDHLDILGPELSHVAFEKAGIIKEGSKAVIGPMAPEVLEIIIGICREKGINSSIFGHNFGINAARGKGATRFWSTTSVQESNIQFEICPNLLGEHQLNNAAVAAEICYQVDCSAKNIQDGVANTYWPGRLEFIEYRGRQILLDCAHNLEGVESLCGFLKSEQFQYITLGFGVLESKDWKKMTDKLMPFVGEWHLLEVDSERALPVGVFADHLSGFGIRPKVHGRDLRGFLDAILKNEGPIVITGSIYLIGELKSLLDIPEKPIWRS